MVHWSRGTFIEVVNSSVLFMWHIHNLMFSNPVKCNGVNATKVRFIQTVVGSYNRYLSLGSMFNVMFLATCQVHTMTCPCYRDWKRVRQGKLALSVPITEVRTLSCKPESTLKTTRLPEIIPRLDITFSLWFHLSCLHEYDSCWEMEIRCF